MSRFPRRSDGTAVTNTYHATGERQRTSGSRTYPVEYTYDHAGRMKTLKTWRNFASDTGAALTTWNYSAQRGFLLSKQYADTQGPTYTYTAAGRLTTRTWSRGITTYYAYNPAGDLASVNHDDNLTPGVTHTYDRRGRRLCLRPRRAPRQPRPRERHHQPLHLRRCRPPNRPPPSPERHHPRPSRIRLQHRRQPHQPRRIAQ